MSTAGVCRQQCARLTRQPSKPSHFPPPSPALQGLATFVVLDLIAIQFGIDSYIFNLLTNGSS